LDLKSRATNMITRPAAEWPVVAVEPQTVSDLMTGYAAPLAAIPAVCGFIGQSLVGVPVPLMGTIRIGVVRGLTGAVVSWVMGLVAVYVCAVIIEKLAPKFQSSGDTVQALKMVVFASTPVWLAGVLQIIPALALLSLIAALYAVYIFYLGLPPVMHTPSSQVVPFMAVAALVMIVLSVVLGMIAASVAGIGAYGTL
jgi:hypothetical protein